MRRGPDQPGGTMSTPFQISLAPDQLMQAINPWTFSQQGGQFGLINIDLGGAADSDLERKILKTVGSYGRQLGRIGDALDILKGQLAAVRQAKAGRGASGPGAASSATQSRPG